MRDVFRWLRGFAPAPVAVNTVERIRACCGALIGILLTSLISRLALGPASGLPLLIAPIGASAVLLFAVPASPLAQPWSVIGGNMISAAIGVTFVHWIADPVLAAGLALAAAIGAMFALRCLHPPSGAIALTAVLGGPAIQAQGYHFVLSPVGVNSSLLLLIAILFNNATRRRYPHAPHLDHSNPHRTADPLPSDRVGFTPADLDDVLKQYNEVLDVSRDDLETIFLQTEMHAYRRRFGEIICADIMSRDVKAVEFGTTLKEAWALMREHRIKALPVIDRARRVTGIVTLVDFMKHAGLDTHDGFEEKLRRFIRRSPFLHSEKPEVVGQIMTAPVISARHAMHIVELVPLMSDNGLHHIPVLDDEQRLAGMVTQSDLIAALYRGRVADMASGSLHQK
ncbi:MAG: rane protein [Burkholderiales bacterium]